MKVIILPKVNDYLDDLSELLYDEGYFFLIENSIKYVRNLLYLIKNELPILRKTKAPKYFKDKYGDNNKDLYYSRLPIKKGKTQWYVFYEVYQKEEEIYYLVSHIANEYEVSQHL